MYGIMRWLPRCVIGLAQGEGVKVILLNWDLYIYFQLHIRVRIRKFMTRCLFHLVYIYYIPYSGRNFAVKRSSNIAKNSGNWG